MTEKRSEAVAGTAPTPPQHLRPTSAEPQAARAVVMVRPKHFGSNSETAASNRFQTSIGDDRDAASIALQARAEFDALARTLEHGGVEVHVVDGRDAPVCPDEVFPNNWFSTHADGTLVLYPMLAPSRRLERRADVIETLRRAGYAVRRIVDLTELEAAGRYLEGTGSLVLDRAARVAFACVSARTSKEAVRIFCERLGYERCTFDAKDLAGHPIYHTNVMMSVGTRFAVVCSEAIRSVHERERVLDALRANGKRVIEIGYTQLHAFAGNLLELHGADGLLIALSQTAHDSLEPHQRDALAEHGSLTPVPIHTIEKSGGGSVRCMLAEVHLAKLGSEPFFR